MGDNHNYEEYKNYRLIFFSLFCKKLKVLKQQGGALQSPVQKCFFLFTNGKDNWWTEPVPFFSGFLFQRHHFFFSAPK